MVENKEHPLISIIVPVYNAEKYLDSCINSIVNQTLKNIEIILIDDGSSDCSYDIMLKWQTRDSRIKIYHQANNGVTSARKKGVEFASCLWIAFVDADDQLPQNALTRMYSFAKDVDLVVGQVGYVGPGKWSFVTLDEKLTQIEYIKKLYLDIVHSVPFARLIKKSILLDPFVFDIPKEITHGEDTIMNYRIATRCKVIRTIPDVVYTYIIREGSASRQNKFASLSYCRLYEKNEWASFSMAMKKDLLFVRWQTIFKRRKRYLKMHAKRILRKIGLV